jgi:hypothetical protein
MSFFSSWLMLNLIFDFQSLTKQYRKHAQSLRQTGGGLEGENGRDDAQDMDMTFRISGSGPDESTPADALNLWRGLSFL